jgi:hypothetical protein
VGTPYDGGSFKIKLVIGADYPSAPPKGEARRVRCAEVSRRARARGGACVALVCYTGT